MFEYVKNEMKNYYSKLPVRAYPKFYPSENVTDLDIREKIYYEMDCFYKEYPDTPSVLLKSRMHSLIAEYCRPKIFTGNPFFFEIGCRDEKQRRYLEMIRDTAVKIPANPPQTFYEGLAMLLFTR